MCFCFNANQVVQKHQLNFLVLYFIWIVGTNGLVIYGGVTEDGFTINPETGVISVTQVLDRELQDHYTITGTSGSLFNADIHNMPQIYILIIATVTAT